MGRPPDANPAKHFAVFKSQNPPVGDSLLHKNCQSTDFEALEL